MPRHPPCALQHFTHNKHAQTTKPDTKRCSHPLCNTQHTTTPRTHHTTTTPTHPNTAVDALDGPDRERPPQENPTNPQQVSSQDPTARRTRPPRHGVWPYVPPSHTPTNKQDVESKERKTPQHSSRSSPTLHGKAP